jgi:hypothetical protein
MAFQGLLHEARRSGFIADLRSVTLEDLSLVIEGPPQIDHLTIELSAHLIEVSAPMAEAARSADALAANVAGEHRPEPVPPHPHGLTERCRCRARTAGP